MMALIQGALDLGWTLWPYGADFDKPPAEIGDDPLSVAYTNWRDWEQARNLARILHQLPTVLPCSSGVVTATAPSSPTAA
ncbi:MAG: hypothetical protein M3O70_26815 [Actinomycetota bacterium]|nr:hypothetical protein [Actinomycetota bacterium]